MDSCFDLFGSRQHGVASNEVIGWLAHWMQMVMNPNETQIQIFDKEQTKDTRKNPELGLKTDSLFRGGWGMGRLDFQPLFGKWARASPRDQTREIGAAEIEPRGWGGVGKFKKSIKYCTASQFEKSELRKADRTVEVVRWPFLDLKFLFCSFTAKTLKRIMQGKPRGQSRSSAFYSHCYSFGC